MTRHDSAATTSGLAFPLAGNEKSAHTTNSSGYMPQHWHYETLYCKNLTRRRTLINKACRMWPSCSICVHGKPLSALGPNLLIKSVHWVSKSTETVPLGPTKTSARKKCLNVKANHPNRCSMRHHNVGVIVLLPYLWILMVNNVSAPQRRTLGIKS